MRSDIATVVAFGLVCSTKAAAPTYSCFDPPDVGQSNPLGVGVDVWEYSCCEALIDESDMDAGRMVFWDPENCNHGPGATAISEAFLCRAHDTDGCRFCHDTCNDFDGLCVECSLDFSGFSSESPTPSPIDGETLAPSEVFPTSPVPSTAAPVEPVETPAPTIAAGTGGDPEDGSGDVSGTDSGDVSGTDSGDVPGTDSGDVSGTDSGDVSGTDSGDVSGTDSGDVSGTDSGDGFGTDSGNSSGDDSGGDLGEDFGDDSGNDSGDDFGEGSGDGSGEDSGEGSGEDSEGGCSCVENLSGIEAEVLARRGKTITCDSSCSDNSDATWGVLNCNYFALGQDCRACADTCEEVSDSNWLDIYDAPCKPCSAISS